MDVPEPGEGDVNAGIGVFIACWTLTALAGVVLICRYAVKVWVQFALHHITAPERIWGSEDVMFCSAFALDILHITLLKSSQDWGLGRHFYYLTALEKTQALKYNFASQPVAVAAALISRTGMMWFLLKCFSAGERRIRWTIVACIVVHFIVNAVTIVQIVVQCGPNPYRAVNRLDYFHYMWDPLPTDGSVKCQSPDVQTTVGFVQGGFNTVIDWFLAVSAAFELWQSFIRTLRQNTSRSLWSQIKQIRGVSTSRRIWQTLTLSGPLILSGIASIVKTYLLKFLGDRLDFTYNIIDFILWVKIENYCILLASSAAIIRLFLRVVVDQRHINQGSARRPSPPGYWSGISSARRGNAMELNDSRNGTKQQEGGLNGRDPAALPTADSWDKSSSQEGNEEFKRGTNATHRHDGEDTVGLAVTSRPSNANEDSHITVRTDLTVHVDDNDGASTSHLVTH